MDVLIAAAGEGSRFKNKIPKAYVKLAGKPLLWYSINAFDKCSKVERVYVIISENNEELYLKSYNKYLKNIKKLSGYIIGGKTRSQSVYNGLKYIYKNDKNVDFVAIHDAARPFLKQKILYQVYNAAKENGGSAPYVPLVDTIKIMDENNLLTEHLLRSSLAAIQTPQIFDFETLFSKYSTEKNIEKFTDDTEIFALSDKKVKLIESDDILFKVTYPEHLKKAHDIYKKDKKQWI